jgi:hypothetical protein
MAKKKIRDCMKGMLAKLEAIPSGGYKKLGRLLI